MKSKFFSLYFLLLLGSYAYAVKENFIELSNNKKRNSIGRADSCDNISPKQHPQKILKQKLKEKKREEDLKVQKSSKEK